MMRRLSTLAIVVVTNVLAASQSAAQTSVSLAGGAAIPVANADDALKTGYNATVALHGKPPLASVGVRLEGMFNSFAVEDGTAGDANRQVIAAILNATFSGSSVPIPMLYLIAGVGVYSRKTTGASPSANSNTDVGFNGGAGINLSTGVGLFLEARYHHVPSEGRAVRFVPITFGLRF